MFILPGFVAVVVLAAVAVVVVLAAVVVAAVVGVHRVTIRVIRVNIGQSVFVCV